jgi:putative nucleotidyltransferase with HDIG domain
MGATGALMLRDNRGFQAIRRVLGAGPGLVRHSLTVGFLSMGLARHVLAADTNVLLVAGLAGLLHDVGRVGHEELDHDPEHTVRGHDYLRTLNLPVPVLEAALYHHERFDGSGFLAGLKGAAIPEIAQIVGIVNTFDKIYSGQRPRVGVFDALRIMAQAYRGCFDERLAQALVKLFRN